MAWPNCGCCIDEMAFSNDSYGIDVPESRLQGNGRAHHENDTAIAVDVGRSVVDLASRTGRRGGA